MIKENINNCVVYSVFFGGKGGCTQRSTADALIIFTLTQPASKKYSGVGARRVIIHIVRVFREYPKSIRREIPGRSNKADA